MASEEPKEERLVLSSTGLVVPTDAKGRLAPITNSGDVQTILHVETPAVVQHAVDGYLEGLIPAAVAFEQERQGRKIPLPSDLDSRAARSAEESLKPGRLEKMIARLRVPGDPDPFGGRGR